MKKTAKFIGVLLQQVPELKEDYDEHLKDNDTLLPHVFMGAVARFVISECENPRNSKAIQKLLQYLESGLITGDEEIKDLVLASFVENLIGETVALKVLRPFMGTNLKKAVKLICGS